LRTIAPPIGTVPEVTPAGQVTALRRGETPIIVRYEGQFATATITVLGDRTNYAWVDIPENNHVDTLINKKLKKIKALPSDLATEDVFIRRVYLDVIGVSPTPEEVRQYLAEGKSEKSPENSSSSYPDLKANEAFRQLQARISGLETAIADRREVYNDSVNANNVRLQTFPDVLVASFGDFHPAKLLEFMSDQKSDVDVKALFAR